MPTIKDLQKKTLLPKIKINRNLKKIVETLKLKQDFTVVFVDNKTIKSLNKRFLKKTYTTDVLAFGFNDNKYLGDIIISADAAKENAKKFKTSLFYELNLYLVHGLLHLLGFNDLRNKERFVMRKKEAQILKKIGEGLRLSLRKS